MLLLSTPACRPYRLATAPATQYLWRGLLFLLKVYASFFTAIRRGYDGSEGDTSITSYSVLAGATRRLLSDQLGFFQIGFGSASGAAKDLAPYIFQRPSASARPSLCNTMELQLRLSASTTTNDSRSYILHKAHGYNKTSMRLRTSSRSL